jgi:hypothetical protein
MLRLFVVAIVSVLPPSVAYARDWNILSFKDGKCHPSAEVGIASPEALHQNLRSEGITDRIKVEKMTTATLSLLLLSSPAMVL